MCYSFWCCVAATGPFDVWKYALAGGPPLFTKDHHNGDTPGTEHTIDIGVFDDGSFAVTGAYEVGSDRRSPVLFDATGIRQWVVDNLGSANEMRCLVHDAGVIVCTDDNGIANGGGVIAYDLDGDVVWQSGSGGVVTMEHFQGKIVMPYVDALTNSADTFFFDGVSSARYRGLAESTFNRNQSLAEVQGVSYVVGVAVSPPQDVGTSSMAVLFYGGGGWSLRHNNGSVNVSVHEVIDGAVEYHWCHSALITDNLDVISAWGDDTAHLPILAMHDVSGAELWTLPDYGIDVAAPSRDFWGLGSPQYFYIGGITFADNGDVFCASIASGNQGVALVDQTGAVTWFASVSAAPRLPLHHPGGDWAYFPNRRYQFNGSYGDHVNGEGSGGRGGRLAMADGAVDDDTRYAGGRFIFARDDESKIYSILPTANSTGKLLHYGATIPTSGTFKLNYSGTDYTINYNDAAQDIQFTMVGSYSPTYVYGEWPMLRLSFPSAVTFTDIDLNGDIVLRDMEDALIVEHDEDGTITDIFDDDLVPICADWNAGILTLGGYASDGNCYLRQYDCTGASIALGGIDVTLGAVDADVENYSGGAGGNYGGMPISVAHGLDEIMHVAVLPQFVPMDGGSGNAGVVPRRGLVANGKECFTIDAAPILYKSGSDWAVTHDVACAIWWEYTPTHPYNSPVFDGTLWGTGAIWNASADEFEHAKQGACFMTGGGSRDGRKPENDTADPRWLTTCVLEISGSDAINYLWIETSGKLVRWTDDTERETDGGTGTNYGYHHIVCAGGDYVYFVRYRNHSTNTFDAVGRLPTDDLATPDWSDGPGVGVATGSTGAATCPGYCTIDTDGNVWFTTLLIASS